VTIYPFNQDLPGRLGPANLIQGQLDRPYPQYGNLRYNGFGCCDSYYHSLQATVTKRFAGGGTMLVAYTNAKLLSNTDTLTDWLEGGTSGGSGPIQDWNNLKGEKSLSAQDVSQRLVISYVLDLPFGKGKRYFSGGSGVGSKLVSGWGLDGVTTFQRGFPVKLQYGQGNSLTALGLTNGNLRPNVVSGCNKDVSGGPVSETQWLVQHRLFRCATRLGLRQRAPRRSDAAAAGHHELRLCGFQEDKHHGKRKHRIPYRVLQPLQPPTVRTSQRHFDQSELRGRYQYHQQPTLDTVRLKVRVLRKARMPPDQVSPWSVFFSLATLAFFVCGVNSARP
jgi:hypothetical protein